MTGIIRAGAADLDALAAVIADAFHDLPPSRWLIADQASRRSIFPSYFRIYLDHALTHGVIYATPERTGTAIWLPVASQPQPDPAGYLPRLTAVTGTWTDRFLAFDRVLDAHHLAGMAYHHLAILAVRPDRQGHGTGTALLGAHHRELDRNSQPAYLEASSERSRDLYRRHGYALRPDAPFYLPDGGPPFWPMWREPRRAARQDAVRPAEAT